MFPHPAVAGGLMQVVESRVHNDGDNQDVVREWQNNMIHTYSTPSYALVDPKTEEVISIHEGPEMDAEVFGAWLDAAIASWEKRK